MRNKNRYSTKNQMNYYITKRNRYERIASDYANGFAYALGFVTLCWIGLAVASIFGLL